MMKVRKVVSTSEFDPQRSQALSQLIRPDSRRCRGEIEKTALRASSTSQSDIGTFDIPHVKRE